MAIRRDTHVYRCDYLVIGSGLAGLYFALEVAERGTVCIVTKDESACSNTKWAQGGISAVFASDDSFENHIADTLKVGAGLCRPEMVQHAVARGPELVSQLSSRFGVDFDRSGDSDSAPFALGREGGHSHRRVVHAQDTTGAAIQDALIRAAKAHPNIQFFEHHVAIDLLSCDVVLGRPGCFGCYALDTRNDRVVAFVAPTTTLASGGAGKVYRYTSNPDVATGDGIAMAYRLGAEVANLEFFQFHPTCLHHPEAKSFLISEALRGEGGILRRSDGSELMAGQHELGSLAPRDIVARSIDHELKRSGRRCVYLDMTHIDHGFLPRRFPAIFERCLELGIDMRSHWIPVVPAAHYSCGGIVVDVEGRSSVPGLIAIGEAAMSGMHGACRLASNSLLEAVVLAEAASRIADDFRVEMPQAVTPWNEGDAVDSDEAVMVSANWEEARALMWNYVGIVRSDKRLRRAERRLDLLRSEIAEYYWRFRVTRDILELRNIALVGQLIVECAQSRRESRGLHFTLDAPEMNSGPAKDSVLQRQRRPRA